MQHPEYATRIKTNYRLKFAHVDDYNSFDRLFSTTHPEGSSFIEAANTIICVKGNSNYKYYKKWCPDADSELTAYELTVGHNCIRGTDWSSQVPETMNRLWVSCVTKEFIMLKCNFLDMELEIKPLKKLVDEQRLVINIDAGLISGLKNSQKELLEKIEKISIKNNLIQDSSDQKELLLIKANDLIKEQQETIDKQNNKIANLQRSVEETNASIKSLEGEKIIAFNQMQNSITNFKIEKLEYKRIIKELMTANNNLSTLLVSSTKSASVSYATSDDEG